MKTHITGMGMRNRRSKGKNSKPLIYLLIEIFVLSIAVFFISLMELPLLTGVSALGAIFYLLVSCVPRYKKIRARQVEKHTHNNIHK